MSLGVDKHPWISYIGYMKEINIKVSNISQKQWPLLLVELNLVAKEWKKYGPKINIKIAYWLQNNVDFDQLILEFYNPDDPAGGWVHVSYNEAGANRKQVLTYDGKSYENGLPEMKWEGGKVKG